jgi:hypothetical protein
MKAHPDVAAPHPGGEQAEPWPPQADEILSQHQALYRALCDAWEAACKARDAAEAEAAAPPDLPALLPDDITAHAAARHQLWRDTARQRAELAAGHADQAADRAVQAARGYAVTALAAFRAAVAGSRPLGTLQPPGYPDAWDEPRLEPPARTGIPAIDDEAGKLHAAAMGVPAEHRGPAPARRRRSYYNSLPATPEPPGSQLAALAQFLHRQASGGKLTRRLHAAAGHLTTAPSTSPARSRTCPSQGGPNASEDRSRHGR